MISTQIKYINHINEKIQFGENGLYIQENELHDYKWIYTVGNNKISSFDRGVVEKKINVIIAGPQRKKAIEAANQLMEYTEKDILAKTPGKLYFGDFYLSCYLIASAKSEYNDRRGFITIELTIVADAPAWVREISKYFSKRGGSGTGKNLDFPYGQPFDFAIGTNSTDINNIGFTPCDFKMDIYGPEVNPSLFIGGHKYELKNITINRNEYVTIDSKRKTIILTDVHGRKTNKFNCRSKESYIFEKIPNGVNAVTWVDDFDFNVTIYEERSEPKWT